MKSTRKRCVLPPFTEAPHLLPSPLSSHLSTQPVQRGAHSAHSSWRPASQPWSREKTSWRPWDVRVCDQNSGFICFALWPSPGMNLAPTGTLWGAAGQGPRDTGGAPLGSLRAVRCLSGGNMVFLTYTVLGEGSKCWLSGRAVPPSVLEPAVAPLPSGPVSLFMGYKGPVAGWSPLIKSRDPGMLEESCGTHLAGGAHPRSCPLRGCHPHPVPCPRQVASQEVESSSLERAGTPDPGLPGPPQACVASEPIPRAHFWPRGS